MSWDGIERRQHSCRRAADGDICHKHEDLIGMWKWILLTIGGATLGMAGLVFSEATHIHSNQDIIKQTLTDLKLEVGRRFAEASTRIEINTKRLDELEEHRNR